MGNYVVKYRDQAIALQQKLLDSDMRLYPVMEIIKALINYQGDETQTIAFMRSGKWRVGKIYSRK